MDCMRNKYFSFDAVTEFTDGKVGAKTKFDSSLTGMSTAVLSSPCARIKTRSHALQTFTATVVCGKKNCKSFTLFAQPPPTLL